MPTAIDLAADLARSEFWYVHAKEQTFGPFSPSQMEELAEQGRLGAETIIAPAGGGGWITVAQLIGAQSDSPTPSQVAAIVGVEQTQTETILPSYQEHVASYADEGPADEDTAEEDTAQAASSELIEFNAIAARNQAAMSLRTSDEPENIRPVRVDDIEFIAPCMGAALPPVCPGCGNPGTNERLERYRKSADWLLIFNLFSFTPGVIPMSLWYLRFGGLVPYLVISAIFGTQGSIAIFVCDNCLKRVKTRKASGVVLLAAGISAGAAALVFKIPQLFALAAPLVLLGTVFAMDKLLRVKRAAKRDGVMEFRFTRGHTRFLVAIKHMYP